MKKVYIALIVITVILAIFVLVSRNCVFPLGAGSIEPGLQAIESLRSVAPFRPKNSFPLVAVIVEPRVEDLVKIVRHFLDTMPDYTHFQVYHGTRNKDLLLDTFGQEIESDKISLWDLGVDNLNSQSYSRLLTSPVFWNTVASEQVLIFQTDAITCRQSPFKIEDFFDYDYVGAPASNLIGYLTAFYFMLKGYPIGHRRFFNGGLSYRTRSTMLDIIEKYPWDKLTPEDIWFCAFLPLVGARVPSVEEARKFSFEAEKLTCIPWGLHKPRKEYDKLCDICPEVKEIPYIPSHTDYRNLYLL